MLRLSACAILALFCIGCSYHIDSYKKLRNVDIRIGGRLNHPKAENDAQNFEDQWNKQFNSNVKMPRLPFYTGRFVDSLIERDGLRIVYIEGEF